MALLKVLHCWFVIFPLAQALRVDETTDRDLKVHDDLEWLRTHYTQLDPAEATEALVSESSDALLKDEIVEMAFHSGHYRKLYFTNRRVLYRPKEKFRTRAQYTSIPYDSIKTYKLNIANAIGHDKDSLVLYLNTMETPTLGFSFRRNDASATIYEISSFFAKKLFGITVAKPSTSMLQKSDATVNSSNGWVGDTLAWLGGDASEVDSGEIEKTLRESIELLGTTEKVSMAFTCGRDTMVMTSDRIISIDVRGWSGKRITYTIIPYESIKGFEVETAGTWDSDAELYLWTDIPGQSIFDWDFRSSKSDPSAINRLLSDRVLGTRMQSTGSSLAEAGNNASGVFDIFNWLADRGTTADPKEVELRLREQGVLQGKDDENVLMAFRTARDYNVLTNKRLMLVDVKGLSGQRVSYRSLPYHAMHSYAVEVGGLFDGEAVVSIWTAIPPPPPPPRECKDDVCEPPRPPCPTLPDWQTCMSIVEFSLAKGAVDVWEIQMRLSELILGTRGEAKDVQAKPSQFRKDLDAIQDLFNYFTDDGVQMTSEVAQIKLAQILKPSEQVQIAFRVGADVHAWTNERILFVDRGITGKTTFKSTPYHTIKAFSVTTAGFLDRDAEVEFWTAMPWMPKYMLDLRKGKYDFNDLMQVLGVRLIHMRPPRASMLSKSFLDIGVKRLTNPFGDAARWIRGSVSELNATQENAKFHSDPPILLKDEDVWFAGQAGRDIFVLTSNRVLVVDTQGLSGTSIRYLSIFYRAVESFYVRSSGTMDVDTTMVLTTSAATLRSFIQRFGKDVDISKISSLVAHGVLDS